MTAEVFNRYSTYYDLLYRDKDYPAEARYVAEVLRAADPRAKSILELGCGTGRHAMLLAQEGFEVLGVERSAQMAAKAQKAPEFDCVTGDIRDISLRRVFDAVVALFHVMSYQTATSDLRQVFETARRHLKSGGHFFFDVWHGPAVLAERPSVRVKRAEDAAFSITRIAEPELDANANCVIVRYTLFAHDKRGGTETVTETHRLRYFFPVEIAGFAEQNGFEVIRSEEFLRGGPLSEKTWGAAYLLRKTADDEP